MRVRRQLGIIVDQIYEIIEYIDKHMDDCDDDDNTMEERDEWDLPKRFDRIEEEADEET